MTTTEPMDTDSNCAETEVIHVTFDGETVIAMDAASDKQGQGTTKSEALHSLSEALRRTAADETQRTTDATRGHTERGGDGPNGRSERRPTRHDEGFSDQPSDRLRPGEETYCLEELRE